MCWLSITWRGHRRIDDGGVENFKAQPEIPRRAMEAQSGALSDGGHRIARLNIGRNCGLAILLKATCLRLN